MAGGNHFFIDYRADVQAFRHTDVIDIFYFRHCFAHSHAFGGKAGQDIGLRVTGQGYESFRVFQSLFNQQVHIPSVSVDNHGLIIEQLCQAVTAVYVVIHNFYLHVIRYILCCTDCDAAAAHNHHIAYVGIFFLSGNFSDVRDVFPGSGEVYDIVQFDGIVSTGDNGFGAPFDGYYVIGNIRRTQFGQRDIQYFGFFTHLCTDQDK